ncbi:unnamed protein product, partial [Rotaria sordida]
ITPYASALECLMHYFREQQTICGKCRHVNYNHEAIQQRKLQKVDFIWVNRDVENFSWFLQLLNDFENEQLAYLETLRANNATPKRYIDFHFYFTSLKSNNQGMIGYAPFDLAANIYQNVSNRDVLTKMRTKTILGRPQWSLLFAKFKAEHQRTSVFFTGKPIHQDRRCINKPIFDQIHLHKDDDSDSTSESESVTGKKYKESLVANSSSQSVSSNDLQSLLYSKKTFITCRNPTDSFYLCQLLQNVYNHTKQIRIRWCSIMDEHGDENTCFKLDYEDKLDPHTILTEIPTVIHHGDKTMSLKKQEIIETNRLLEKSIKGESMEDKDNNQKQSTKKRRRIDSDQTARKLSFFILTGGP